MATRKQPQNSADYYIALIQQYQAQVGKKVVPPAAWNRKLSWWLSWRRRNRDTPAFLVVELQLNELNVSCDDGTADVARRSDKPAAVPRGLSQSLEEIDRSVEAGLVPTLLSPIRRHRHLAVWLLRAQAGLLTRRQIPEDQNSPQQQHLKHVLSRVAEHQPVLHMAAEWLDFCQRVTCILPKARRADGWAQPVANIEPRRLQSICPGLSEQRTAFILGAKRSFAAVPAPAVVIGAINRVLGVFDNPVTLATDRPQTLAFLHLLLAAGIPVSHDEFLLN